MKYFDWYEKTYPELFKQGIWLRGGELNTLSQDEFKVRSFRALFTRLSTYFDVANSFTHQFLYQMNIKSWQLFRATRNVA